MTRIRFFLLLFLFFSYAHAKEPVLLITGGAGYIGSATVAHLLNNGYSIIVIDKELPESSYFKDSQIITDRSQLPQISLAKKNSLASNACFIQADFADPYVLSHIFSHFSVQAIIHFAGSIEVARSVKDPSHFYANNVAKTITLLSFMIEYKINAFIFPSSAAVYGFPGQPILSEDLEKSPINPYGRTKHMVEMILDDFVQAYPDFKAVSLRFFNASGALPDYDIGELHEPETHLIPLVLQAAYKKTRMNVFGNDYTTPDGTCVRDYLHIQDLAEAHFLALNYLLNNDVKHTIFNLGTGTGYSVKEVIDCVTAVTGMKLDVHVAERRAGDPDTLVANSRKAQHLLNWQPTHSSLTNIIETAHTFYKMHACAK